MNLEKSIIKISQDQSILIGSKLRLTRLTCRYNQIFVGKELDISFQQIQKYEKGKNRIFAPKSFQFAKLVKYPIGYFFAGLLDLENKYKKFEEKSIFFRKFPEKDIYRLNKFFLKIVNSNICKNIINITKDFAESCNIKKVRSDNNQQFNSINQSLATANSIDNSKSETSIQLTAQERNTLIQLIKNKSPFSLLKVKEKEILKYIQSLIKKGFIVRNEKTGLFAVEKNACLLFEIEGEGAFDEIIK